MLVFLAFCALEIPTLRDSIQGQGWTRLRTGNLVYNTRLLVYGKACQGLAPYLVLFAIQLHALGRWFGTRTWQMGTVLVTAVGLSFILWIGPYFLGFIGPFFGWREGGMAWMFSRIADISPISWFILQLEKTGGIRLENLVPAQRSLIRYGAGTLTLWIHGAITLVFAFLAWRSTHRSIRELTLEYSPGTLRSEISESSP